MKEDVAVWVVHAEEGWDGGGGEVTLLLVTASEGQLPDVVAAFDRQRDRDDCQVVRINKIELFGTFPVLGFLLVDAVRKEA